MRRWLVALALCAPIAAAAQAPITVRATWDAAATSGVSAELERDGIIVPCALQLPVVGDQSCTATVPALPGTYRLRMRNAQGEPGDWSLPVTAAAAVPGIFRLTWHSPISQGETMAIAYVDSEIAASNGGATFPSVSVTGSADNAIAIVALGWFDSSESRTATPRIGGSSSGFVQIGATHSVSGGAFRMSLWRKLAPGTGTLSIDATASASVDNMFLVGAVYSGVDQTTPTGTLATAAANSTAPSISPSGGVSDGMLIGFFQSFQSSMTIATGTQREQTYNAAVEKTAAFADRAVESGAVSFTQTSHIWGAIGVALLPASGGGGGFQSAWARGSNMILGVRTP